MRITFFILLLANLVMLLWQTQIHSDQTGRGDLPEIASEERLVMLSEHRGEGQVAADADGSADQSPVDSEQTSEQAEDTLGLPEIEIAADETADAAEEPTGPAAAEPGKVCYTMGPFKELNRAKEVAGRLDSLGADVSRRSKVEQEQYGYWVFLEPFSSRDKAVSEARRLAEHGIRDYYIVTDDEERENGISLGLFRKKSGAIRRMAQVRRFDFDPKMEIRYRDTTIYWLDYEYTEDIDVQPLWRELTEETPDLQRLDRDCQPQQTG